MTGLQERNKWLHPRNLQLNDFVLVHEDNVPPQQWVIGRVVTTVEGQDGKPQILEGREKHTDGGGAPQLSSGGSGVRRTDGLVNALFVGDEYTGYFNGVCFKGGMLLVDCQDQKSATWLTEVAPRLEGWKGLLLCLKRGEEIPHTFQERRLQNPPPLDTQSCGVLQNKQTPPTLGCDANAHHTEWGSTDCNERGEALLEFVISKNMSLENVGSEPTFVTNVCKEVLDITLGNDVMIGLVSHLRGWKSRTELRHVHIPRNTNWDIFKETLSKNISGVEQAGRKSTTAGLESRLSAINQSIMDAYHCACPLRATTSKQICSWWSRKLSALRHRVPRLFNKAKRTGDWEEYKQNLTTYNKELKLAKTNSFRKFYDSVSSTPEAAQLLKALSRGKTDTVLSIKRQDGIYTTSAEERAETLLQAHFPETVQADLTPASVTRRPDRLDWLIAKNLFTVDSVKWALASFSRYKSPGVDGVFPALLQQGMDILLPHLLGLMRDSLALSYISEPWIIAKVIIITKVGRRDYSLAKSFRPKSLTPFMLKGMEKVIDNHIRSEALKIAPLHARQHAYRAGRSTYTALYQPTSELQDSLDNGEVAICAFLDIKGTFDNASHTSVIKALEGRNVTAP
ncbi:uncharacterized protein LOC126766612, partial [Bactrocera neohumeralis]|uniref:uncharacterized protein LOC126766612 n=1 Tax=Bactrocera neohumeralis TaxID=98809 RepID=UPI002165DCC8